MDRRLFAKILLWSMRLFAVVPFLNGASALFRASDLMRLGAPAGIGQQLALGVASTAIIAYFAAGLVLVGIAEILRIAVDLEAQGIEKATEDRMLSRARDVGAPDASYLLQE